MKTLVPEKFVDLRFPLAGIDRSTSFARQPNRPGPDGSYARTTPVGQNVRAFEPSSNRARGGQRAGLARYINARVNGAALIQEIRGISGVGYTAPGGGTQSSQSGRVNTIVAVSGGTVKVADAGATAWTTATNGTTALITSGLIQSAPNNQKLYFADGTNAKYYDPATGTGGTVSAWTATVGSLPVGSDGGTPRLIETWRGGTMLSGLIKDPQNWFLSYRGDPTNFLYGTNDPLGAVAGNNSNLGKVGDVITALIAYSDDIFYFGGDHTIWALQGDPNAGGQIYNVSDAIGMAWGTPWCRDPYGALYFVSNRMGIYRIAPGSAPQRISQQIEQIVAEANTGSHTIRLAWDDRYQGLHVFITKTAAAAAATHLFWEARVGAWWTDVFKNNDHNPLCTCVFDGNLPEDRVTLIGSWDGYVRFLDPDATTDDGEDIESEVVIGPITSKDLDEFMLEDIQAILGEDSGDVTYAVYVANTPEKAVQDMEHDTAVLTGDAGGTLRRVAHGTFSASRSRTNYIHHAGHALYLKLTATNPWAMETVRARITYRGDVRRRGA